MGAPPSAPLVFKDLTAQALNMKAAHARMKMDRIIFFIMKFFLVGGFDYRENSYFTLSIFDLAK
jgi:hypothetical protein